MYGLAVRMKAFNVVGDNPIAEARLMESAMLHAGVIYSHPNARHESSGPHTEGGYGFVAFGTVSYKNTRAHCARRCAAAPTSEPALYWIAGEATLRSLKNA